MKLNELRKLAGLPLLKEEKQVITEAMDQKALNHSMDALKSADPSDRKGFEHSTNAMSASINADHDVAANAHKEAAEYHEKAGNKVAASHHGKAAEVHQQIADGIADRIHRRENPPKDSLAHVLKNPDQDLPDDHPHKPVVDLLKKYRIKESKTSKDKKEILDISAEKHHVKKKGKVVKVGSKKACMDYCDDNDGCTLHKGMPMKEDYISETVLHDMLDQLITKVGKEYGVDFKDADGPAVRKAMAEMYHAGAGKGRHG